MPVEEDVFVNYGFVPGPVYALMHPRARVEASPPVLHVHQLRGQFVRTARRIPYLDDKQSYAVVIESGEIALDVASLNALMTRTLGGDRSNVDKLRLTIADDGTLTQKGAIDSAIDIPFSVKSTVSVTADGRIQVSPNLGIVAGGVIGEVQHLDVGQERGERGGIMTAARRHLNAVEQL